MSDFLLLHTDRDLFGGLRGKSFQLLMQLCFNYADSFSLSKTSMPTYPSAVEDMLSPYLKTSIQSTTWFAYHGVDPLIEMIYAAVPETLDILTLCYQDIFLKKKGNVPKKKHEQMGQKFVYPSVLEDICFFSGRQMILGTLSHEYICMARCVSQEFEEKLLSLAHWDKTDKDVYHLNFTPF